LITGINICGGLFVGVSQQGLSFSEALGRYTLFTIGDGLVSQIPALLVAVSAGIAVTRVEASEGSFVGRELFEQLATEPQALMTTGGVLLVLSLVPGLPTTSFAVAGLLLFGSGRGMRLRRSQLSQVRATTAFQPKIYSPLVLRVSAEATNCLRQEMLLPKAVQQMRAAMFERMGVLVPDPQMDLDGTRSGRVVEIFLNGALVGKVLDEQDGETAGIENGDATSEAVTANGLKIAVRDTLSGKTITELRNVVGEHLVELLDDTHTRLLLEVHQPLGEDLINAAIPSVVSVTELTTVLRSLVRDEISIRELRTVLQAVLEFDMSWREQRKNAIGDSARRMQQLVRFVREKRSREITRLVCGDSRSAAVWLLDPAADQLFSRVSELEVAIPPDAVDGLLSEVARVSEAASEQQAHASGVRPVLVTSAAARGLVSEVLQLAAADVRVVASSELLRDVSLEVVATLSPDISLLAEEEAEYLRLTSEHVTGGQPTDRSVNDGVRESRFRAVQ
ncbi:MAG: FHIPEP family type III secretion protein, partial [Bdellovibrionales bacterium]|nr:FHIPEP family type III secretion protein [Bdellovibrionales bacterium]